MNACIAHVRQETKVSDEEGKLAVEAQIELTQNLIDQVISTRVVKNDLELTKTLMKLGNEFYELFQQVCI